MLLVLVLQAFFGIYHPSHYICYLQAPKELGFICNAYSITWSKVLKVGGIQNHKKLGRWEFSLVALLLMKIPAIQ